MDDDVKQKREKQMHAHMDAFQRMCRVRWMHFNVIIQNATAAIDPPSSLGPIGLFQQP